MDYAINTTDSKQMLERLLSGKENTLLFYNPMVLLMILHLQSDCQAGAFPSDTVWYCLPRPKSFLHNKFILKIHFHFVWNSLSRTL
jgi:hypothetical protein